MFRQETFIEGNGKMFGIGDIVEVHYKKVYQQEVQVCQGRIVKPTILSELKLDISTKFNSKTIEINLEDIIEIYNLVEI